MRQLFPLKEKNPYPSSKIYEGICTCNETYIGETKRNVATRWNEHTNPSKDSGPAKHLNNYPDHKFTWKVVMSAPNNTRLRRYLEAFFIATKRPSLNEQIEAKKLTLFRNGVT